MSEDFNSTLKALREISATDAKLARTRAERKKLEAELDNKKNELEKLKVATANAIKAHQLKESGYKKEERVLKDEQSKLVDRRKALHTLQNYKLQQAAEKEIEAASKQLGQQEETLISNLDEMELLSTSSNELQAKLGNLEKVLAEFMVEYDETCKVLDERKETYLQERAQLVGDVSQHSLDLYNRVADKYPFDALVIFKDNNCSGCFMNLGPQVIQEIGRSKNLVRCRGCGRILYLEQGSV